MFGTPFYHGIIRKCVTIFGTLFNNISIARGPDDEVIKVPITYSSVDKLLARIESNPDLNRQPAMISPRLAFEVLTPTYDSSRKLQTTLERHYTAPDGSHRSQFVGVPYNLEFILYIVSREEQDGLMVLEQILPYFTPGFVVTVKLVEDMEYTIDIPVVLNSVDFENRSFGEFPDRRQLIWTLKFTMKTEFLGPVDPDRSGIIRKIFINFYDMNRHNEHIARVYVQPGLTANGEPTTVFEDSIDVYDINEDDDYGIIKLVGEDLQANTIPPEV